MLDDRRPELDQRFFCMRSAGPTPLREARAELCWHLFLRGAIIPLITRRCNEFLEEKILANKTADAAQGKFICFSYSHLIVCKA
jgi:hypothetical protein